MIRKQALQNIKFYHGMHRFVPTLIKFEGYTVAEEPVRHRPRVHGDSKFNIRNRLFQSIRDLLAVRWMKSRYLRYKIIEKN